MEAPPRIEPQKLGDYLEIMTKSVFQSGISWKVVNSKWPGITEAFRGFDADAVASLSPDDIDALAADTRVIRHRRKLEAIVHNAQTMVLLDAEYDGFRNYLRSHADFDAVIKDLKKRFKFMGDMGIYHFMYVVGEQVPPYDEFCSARR
jgi:3-methyladenine DNA glycosylase Tag